MTNIIKQTLSEKEATLLDSIDGLVAAEKQIILSRAKEAFAEALDFLPVELAMGYDTIYFKVEGKEILSINSRYEKQYYLNTYSTWIDGDFELKRLVFNGMVARVVLENSNVYNEIFAKTELREEIAVLKEQLYAIKNEIDKINREELLEKQAKALESFYKGEEVAFEKARIIIYGRGKYDVIYRVSKLKCISANVSGKKVTIEFTCLSYDTEVEVTHKLEGIQMKYLIEHLT